MGWVGWSVVGRLVGLSVSLSLFPKECGSYVQFKQALLQLMGSEYDFINDVVKLCVYYRKIRRLQKKNFKFISS